MSRTLLPLLACVLCSPATAAPKLKDKAAPTVPIVGEWLAQSRTSGGAAVGLPASVIRLIFREDGTFTWMVGDVDQDPDGHKFTVDAKADPVSIDFVPRDKPAYLGVFKVEADTLTLCFSRAGNPRPTKFESPAGSRTELYVFKRAAKK